MRGLTPSSYRKFQPIHRTPGSSAAIEYDSGLPLPPPLKAGFANYTKEQPVSSWGLEEVAGWALAVSFGSKGEEYAARLVAMGIEGPDLKVIAGLPEAEASDCLKEIGICAPLHQRKLLREIGHLK